MPNKALVGGYPEDIVYFHAVVSTLLLSSIFSKVSYVLSVVVVVAAVEVVITHLTEQTQTRPKGRLPKIVPSPVQTSHWVHPRGLLRGTGTQRGRKNHKSLRSPLPLAIKKPPARKPRGALSTLEKARAALGGEEGATFREPPGACLLHP